MIQQRQTLSSKMKSNSVLLTCDQKLTIGPTVSLVLCTRKQKKR